MKRSVLKNLLITLACTIPVYEAIGQCAAGWNAATVNWDNLDYLTRNGTYNTFVTNQMRDTQYFAFGINRVKIQLNGISTNGENATNTAEAGSYGTGDDVEYGGLGSIVFTFDTVVRNFRFSLFDIDNSQMATVTALDALGVPLTINMVRVTGGIITVIGNGTVSATATASGAGANNGDARGSVNVGIGGGVNGIQSVTITMTGNSGNFWLSDLTACIFGNFPLNYYASQKPFTGQPGYYLVTPDNNSVYLFNPLTGVSDWLFSEPSSPWVNSMAYDHVNKILYYVRDNPTPLATNKMLKKYDFNTESIGVVVNDITTLGIPVYDFVVESAGAAFYNGSLFIGMEGTKRGGAGQYATNRESVIWRIDFDAAQNPVKVCQVFARPADNGSGTLTHDWGDFTIKDGVLYDFNTGNVGSTSQFVHFNMQTGNSVNYNTNGNPAPIQVGQTWDGKLYWTGGQYPELGRVALYNEDGTIGSKIVATVTDCSPAWVGRAGDASDPFKPKSDFGDAPASYDPPGVDPATHEYDCNLFLGPTFDREWNKTPSANATADGSDEDGISTVSVLSPGVVTYVQDVQVYNNTGSNATLVAWLDYDGDGLFSPGEGVSMNIPSNGSPQTVTLSWPSISVGLPLGSKTFLRVRLTSSGNGMSVNTPNNWFANGEVEDYEVFISAILPLELVTFTAQNDNDSRVLLKWTSDKEINFYGFEIERSSDGINWNKIAFVPGSGGQGTQFYSHYDNDPLTGKSYYRLKYIDLDGNYQYSWIVSVDINSIQPVIKLKPNPVNRFATIQFTGSANEAAHIYMINADGKRVINKSVTCQQGFNQVTLDIPATFAAGVYVIQVVTPARTMNVKAVVQRN